MWLVNDYLMDAIQHLIELRALTYMFNEDHHNEEPTTFTYFKHLKKLETLRVQISTGAICNILSALHRANAPLTSLTMTYNASNKQIIDTICDNYCKFISKLHFKYDRASHHEDYIHNIDGEDLQKIINHLPQLTDIGCESDDIKVADILQALQTSNELRTAYFKIDVFDFEREYSNIRSISELARCRMMNVTIEICDKMVSEWFF